MWDTYAKIVGQHTANILTSITDCGPFNILLSELPRGMSARELAVSIEFKGVLTDRQEEVNGYMVCGGVHRSDVWPLLAYIVSHLGLDMSILETETGPQDILDEFLNIVIGVAGADWAEHGFEMDFTTPHPLSGHTLPLLKPDDEAYHLVVSGPTGLQVDIMVVFNHRPAA
jgi:CheY-specific phosphatase CheX